MRTQTGTVERQSLIPIMPGAALQPLDLMEFLIRNPIRSALLYEDGMVA